MKVWHALVLIFGLVAFLLFKPKQPAMLHLPPPRVETKATPAQQPTMPSVQALQAPSRMPSNLEKGAFPVPQGQVIVEKAETHMVSIPEAEVVAYKASLGVPDPEVKPEKTDGIDGNDGE